MIYRKLFQSFLIAFTSLFLISCGNGSSDLNSTEPSLTIVNPVAPNGHDPWVIQKDGMYYYLYSTAGSIWLNSDSKLQDAVQFEGQKIWTPPINTEYSEEIWAPEIFYIDGHWYVYFAADDGDNLNHRMFVLKSETDDPFSEYTFVGKITDSTNKWAIDGTILQHEDSLYFIWSGWEGDENIQQNLYIAKMSSPTEIYSNRMLISQPEYDWEKVGTPLVNEGPQVLQNNNDIFIIYSASGSWTDNYALGQLKLIGNDPLNPDAWEKNDQSVFSSTNKVFSPGHASFTKSPDGTEDWIVYHAAKFQGAGWDRDVNMKPFVWKGNGVPDFGEPVEKGLKIPVPSE